MAQAFSVEFAFYGYHARNGLLRTLNFRYQADMAACYDFATSVARTDRAMPGSVRGKFKDLGEDSNSAEIHSGAMGVGEKVGA
jgi:hypothetical protein